MTALPKECIPYMLKIPRSPSPPPSQSPSLSPAPALAPSPAATPSPSASPIPFLVALWADRGDHLIQRGFHKRRLYLRPEVAERASLNAGLEVAIVHGCGVEDRRVRFTLRRIRPLE